MIRALLGAFSLVPFVVVSPYVLLFACFPMLYRLSVDGF